MQSATKFFFSLIDKLSPSSYNISRNTLLRQLLPVTKFSSNMASLLADEINSNRSFVTVISCSAIFALWCRLSFLCNLIIDCCYHTRGSLTHDPSYCSIRFDKTIFRVGFFILKLHFPSQANGFYHLHEQHYPSVTHSLGSPEICVQVLLT
jgi:hypothetical protein